MNCCTKSSRKVCAHITVKCANCGNDHIANSSSYTSGHKAGVKANKKIKLRKYSEKVKEKGISKDKKVIGEKNKSFKLEIES